MTLEQQRNAAERRGDLSEAARIERLMERLDDQRRAFGSGQRK